MILKFLIFFNKTTYFIFIEKKKYTTTVFLFYPSPHAIYLRGTIEVKSVAFFHSATTCSKVTGQVE